jgi:capsular exopolysaccharide synthesis family protein
MPNKMTEMDTDDKRTGHLNADTRAILKGNATELALAHGNLLSANMGKEVSSLLVTSCHAGEGKTIAALSLAYAISKHAHLRVLLIDGNASSPALHNLLGTDISPGLTDIVFEGAKSEETARETEFTNVSLLPYGSGTASSLALYRSPAFGTCVRAMRSQFDLIILDGPPLLVSSDASLASPHFDGVILVIACEDTQWGVAQHVKTKIESVGGKMLGAVLNKRQYHVPSSVYRRS